LRKLDDKLNVEIKKLRQEKKEFKTIDDLKNKKLEVTKLRNQNIS
jgi:hypothetical protein